MRARISEAFKSQTTQEFIAATKTAEDSGSFEVIISTADIDRQGESIDQNGWDLNFYLQNPIVLWAHDYDSLPIAICDEVVAKDGKLVARGRFAPESANPFAQQVRRLYDLKIVRATSVGFIVRDQVGNIITKAELLEFSFVPVPANPYALSTQRAQELGLNLEMLVIKGIAIEEKVTPSDVPPEDLPPITPQEGDVCKMPDGSPGVMELDDDTGKLVCVPEIDEKPKSAGAATSVEEECLKHEEEMKTAVAAHTQKVLELLSAGAIAGGKEVKIGRVLSERNRTLIKSAIDQFKMTIVALEELLQATEPQGVEGEERSQDGSAPNERSDAAGYGSGDEMTQILALRSVLRSINNGSAQALENINKRLRNSKK